jgi:hypothetical protein
VIYNFRADDLRNFMGDVQLGYVSNRMDDTTGIRFRGQARQGSQMYILVWDQTASDTGQAFYWAMNVESVQGSPQQGNATVMMTDAYGVVVLQGRFNNGLWSGTVQFENTDGARGGLGTFEIPQQAVF